MKAPFNSSVAVTDCNHHNRLVFCNGHRKLVVLGFRGIVLGGVATALAVALPFSSGASRADDHPRAQLVESRKLTQDSGEQLNPSQAIETERNMTAFLNERALRLQKAAGNSHSSESATPRLDRKTVLALAERCAPTTPAASLLSIAQVESGLAPIMIGVNQSAHQILEPSSKGEAIASAKALIAEGRDIDLGLAQINSRNLGWLGLSVDDAFDPCRNLAAAARILDRAYAHALQARRLNQPILQMAYSIYNSGNADGGLANGYVGKVEAARHTAARSRP